MGKIKWERRFLGYMPYFSDDGEDMHRLKPVYGEPEKFTECEVCNGTGKIEEDSTVYACSWCCGCGWIKEA